MSTSSTTIANGRILFYKMHIMSQDPNNKKSRFYDEELWGSKWKGDSTYHSFCRIPRKICCKETGLISFCDFVQWNLWRQPLQRCSQLYIFLKWTWWLIKQKDKDMVARQIINANRNLSHTCPMSKAFCFSFRSTDWPTQIKTSACVSSIKISSVNRSSWEKL